MWSYRPKMREKMRQCNLRGRLQSSLRKDCRPAVNALLICGIGGRISATVAGSELGVTLIVR